MESIIRIIIAVSIIIVLFFAYMKKDKLARNVSYIVLASIMITQALTGFATLIGGIDFLNFLEQIFRGVADVVVFVELGLIIFFTFFKFATKNRILKVSILVYVVLVLLVEFGVF